LFGKEESESDIKTLYRFRKKVKKSNRIKSKKKRKRYKEYLKIKYDKKID